MVSAGSPSAALRRWLGTRMTGLLSVTAAVLLGAGCGGAEATDAKDEGSAGDAPERVVSLSGSLTEVVYALGTGDRMVGRDRSSLYPEAAEALPEVGYGANLSAEGILALRPDLVLAPQSPRDADAVLHVRNAGTPVHTVPDDASLDGARAKIRGVAAALGRAEAGEALIAELDGDVHRLRAALNGRGADDRQRALFLYLRGTNATFVCGPESGYGHMLELAGVDNAAEGVRDCTPMTSEAVVYARPDVIVVLERGLESVGGLDGLRRLPGVGRTPAGRAGRVVAMDDLFLGAFGPRTGRAALALHRAVYDGEGLERVTDP